MRSSLFVRCWATGLFLAGVAMAAPINVVNHSFEDNVGTLFGCGGTGCGFGYNNIEGWTVTGVGGLFRPGSNTLHFDAIPDGEITAFTDNGSIEQTVSETVLAGLVYTLMVDVGNRWNFNQTGEVFLLIGGTAIAATGGAAAEGAFATYTATYTGLPEHVGQSIGIRLSSTSQQGNYDNVRLSFEGQSSTVIPEPGSIALMGLGLLALGASRRRQAH